LSVVWPQNHCDGLSEVWHQNHCDGFSRFGFKTVVMISPSLASKPMVTGFPLWASKLVAAVW
jgi:hypothetical protein